MARLGPWPVTRRVGVAVSGGADSLCLAFLAARWGRPLAFIVDHGLRPEAAAEAALTAARLDAMGVASQILTLRGLGPGAAAARAARYAALREAAAAAGIVDLLLGHHAQDQAETILMRGRAGSGPAGQAGMAAVVHRRGLRLVRPLLAVPPERLRITLRAAGLDWVEDPSNSSPVYLRNRLRAELLQCGGAAALLRHAAHEAAGRMLAEQLNAAWLAEHVCIYPEGFAVLAAGRAPAAALGALIRCIGGRDFVPSGEALSRLAAVLAPCVLGGVRFVDAGKFGPGLLVLREPAAMQAPVCASIGAVWDSRFILEAEDPAIIDGEPSCSTVGGASFVPPALTLGALGEDYAIIRQLSALPAAVLQTLPALRRHGVLAAVPHIGYFADLALQGLVASFAPAHPLAGAPFDAAARDAVGGGCQADGQPPC